MVDRQDRIKNLEDSLNSREENRFTPMREHELSQKEFEVQSSWEEKKEHHSSIVMPQDMRTKIPRIPILTYLLIASMVFFLGAASYAVYSFLGGANTVSNNNISMEISGPVATPGGETLSLDVSVQNRNKTNLEVVELVIDYPEGTRSAGGSEELLHDRIYLGDIKTGEIVRKKAEAVLFGEEKQTLPIKFSLEYRIPNSNAIFVKEASYDIVLSSNPLALNISAPEEAVSGQEFPMKILARSNSNEVVKNVVVNIKYPAGFVFKSSTPSPVTGNNSSWRLGDLLPGEERSIDIKGLIAGEDEEIRSFNVTAGIGSSNDDRQVGTVLGGFKKEIVIKKPFVGLTLAVNGSRDAEVPIKNSGEVSVEIFYVNNLSVPVSDVSINLSLTGVALDKNSVKVHDGGVYQSSANTVTWDGVSISKLKNIEPGQSGSVSVILAPQGTFRGSLTNVRNPQILLSAGVSAKRPQEGNVPETVANASRKIIRVETSVDLIAKINHRNSPIENSGPIPPKSDKETTYSVALSVSNPSNDFFDGVIKTTLPIYSKFVKADPSSGENVSYDPSSREVVWNIGTVPAGTGFDRPAKSVYFQISFTPSVAQIGTAPALTGEIVLTGRDSFTQTELRATKSALTTRTGDSIFEVGDEIVQ